MDKTKLNDSDLEMVNGGIGLEPEGEPPEVDLPWWLNQPNENHNPLGQPPKFQDDGIPS